ncbi:MAG TPA: T9SS type A sorting domain-containing protein, partial [Rubricoccaceae bacterium]|nr:T9SS type A sorting domain-containing protein [Rubricoccaceae bacterium]
PPDAGRPYVAYRFRLLSGSYHETYDLDGIPFDNENPVGDALGANPEDSEVVTAFYRRHYADRWIEDALEVHAGGATGVDLLDRWKIQPEPGNCVRTEYTGSAGRGAFIANRSGPVRAIRSIIGFNSGALMQQDSFFYERYLRATVFFRTHPLQQGPMAYNDYSPNAVGMRRYSNLDPEGLLLDGEPEPAHEGNLEWEVLQGEQGTLVSAFGLSADIPDLQPGSYYSDQAPAGVKQCTGDEALYGASGLRLPGPMPNTDPSLNLDTYALVYERHQLYAAPDLPLDSAHAFVAAARDPLRIQTAPYAIRLGDDPDPPPGPDPTLEGPVFLGTPRPNPSTGVARVTYWLEEETIARLSLYDLAGRRIAVLDEGRRAEGYHDVGIRPGRFPAGTYLIRLETPLGERTVTFVKQR